MNFILQHKKLFVLLILVIIGFSIYSNSFDNEFFWDDDDSIVNNAYIKDWQYLPKYFTQNLIAGAGQVTNYWRPLLLISFAIDYHLWGLNPLGFHLTNTLLHIFAAWLVFLLILKLTKKQYILSFLISLFFLIHPLQTEAVTYVAGRADSLSAVFGLLAILFYVQYRSQLKAKIWHWHSGGWKYLASLFFFILGLLAKEQIILLPLLVLLIELIFLTKRIKKENLWRILKPIAPIFLISAIYFIMRLTILDFNNILHGFEYNELYDNSFWVRMLTFTLVIITYIKLLFAPFGLHMAREVPIITSIFSLPVLIFIVSLTLIIIICLKTWHKNRFITFGFLWFFIILAPHSNIWQINRPMYEHWLYLPMIGFYLALFSLIALIFKKIKSKKNKLALPIIYISLAMLIIYIFGFSILTIRRNNDWQNPITFYEKNLSYTPNSFIQHNNLGMAYADANKHEKAVQEYEKAIAIADKYSQVHHNLGNSLSNLNKIYEAIIEYEKAIAMSPSFQLPYNNLLAIYLEQNNKKKVEEILKKMEVEFGRKINFLYNKGVVYFKLGEYDKAVRAWEKILVIEPTNLEVRELIKQTRIQAKLKNTGQASQAK